MSKFKQLLEKLEDKNYNFIEILIFLHDRFIPFPPMRINSFGETNWKYNMEIWEFTHGYDIEKALIEIDYLKHK